ncbi:MAG: hypothetical protein JXR58_11760 [Bacteroidales bacterium]|nr:hypothetical protein [Bacteroidales bacterium]
MKNILIAIGLCFSISFSFSQDIFPKTVYEASDFKKSHNYEQTIEYSKKLAEASEFIEYKVFGKSSLGYDLPLLILDKDKDFNPELSKKKGKAIVLIEASIHPGEPDGKDAGFLLLRDMILEKNDITIPDNIVVLFIPVLNPDGDKRWSAFNRINQNGPVEMGFRTNGQNLNLNRDFLKADSPEMKHWLKLFTNWLPDFFIDCHTTDGADYQYSLTYGLEIYGNMETELTKWQKEKYLPFVEKKMKEAGHLIFPYVMFTRWHDPRSGLRSWVGSPALSEGYTAVQNRIGLLIETHMLKDYKTRVEATYFMISNTLNYLEENQKEIIELNKNADAKCIDETYRKQPFPIAYKTGETPNKVEFLGKSYSTDSSELTGGNWFRYSNKNETFLLDFYGTQIPEKFVEIPEYYVIPPSYSHITEILKLHGVKVDYTKEEKQVETGVYRFSNVELDINSFEGRQRVTKFEMEKSVEKQVIPAGSALISTKQRTLMLILHALEPEAPSSFFSWGFFNSIFEQKEYAETYVMEKMAREMIEKDPELKREFEEKRKNEPEFVANQWAQTNWFYERTVYKDLNKGLYPIFFL